MAAMNEINNHWTFPPAGYIKINVHGCFSPIPLENGNMTGIGIVIRNDRGKIISMATGTLRETDELCNQLYAILMGLRLAFEANENKVILEMDHDEAYFEWEASIEAQVMDPDLHYVLKQLNIRKKDRNLDLTVDSVHPTRNRLAIYLAEYGRENFNNIVTTKKPFGRVNEIWMEDMGLGPVRIQFQDLDEVVAFGEDEVIQEGVDDEGGV